MFTLIVCGYEIREIFRICEWEFVIFNCLLNFNCSNSITFSLYDYVPECLYGCVSVCVFVNFCCIIVDRFRCWIVSTFSIYFHSKIKRNHWRIKQCRLFSFEARLAKLDPLINVLCFTFSIVDFLFGSFLVKFNR